MRSLSQTDSAGTAALLPALYRAERLHWWSSGMRSVSHALLASAELPAGWIVEAGCGSGMFAEELAPGHPLHPVVGMEINPLALAGRMGHASAIGASFAWGDLQQLPLPDASCAMVVALDVIDQQGVTLQQALAESRRVLRSGGLLFLRVSAYGWLRSPHDQAFGTAHRYSLRKLKLMLRGFQILRFTHANAILLPAATFVRLAQQQGWISVETELNVPHSLNRLLRTVLELEARWLRTRNLPFGLSLYALARKP